MLIPYIYIPCREQPSGNDSSPFAVSFMFQGEYEEALGIFDTKVGKIQS